MVFDSNHSFKRIRSLGEDGESRLGEAPSSRAGPAATFPDVPFPKGRRLGVRRCTRAVRLIHNYFKFSGANENGIFKLFNF